jgi:hypothetical protein
MFSLKEFLARKQIDIPLLLCSFHVSVNRTRLFRTGSLRVLLILRLVLK